MSIWFASSAETNKYKINQGDLLTLPVQDIKVNGLVLAKEHFFFTEQLNRELWQPIHSRFLVSETRQLRAFSLIARLVQMTIDETEVIYLTGLRRASMRRSRV